MITVCLELSQTYPSGTVSSTVYATPLVNPGTTSRPSLSVTPEPATFPLESVTVKAIPSTFPSGAVLRISRSASIE